MRAHDLIRPMLILALLGAGMASEAARPRAPAPPPMPAGVPLPLIPQPALLVAAAPAAMSSASAAPPPVAGGERSPVSILLAQVHAAGTPIFSPDGRWLAVREDDGGLALLDVPASVADPSRAPSRYALAPAVVAMIGGGSEIGSPACFSGDSAAMLFRAPAGLEVLSLPPHGPAVPLRDPADAPTAHGCVPALGQAPAPRGAWPILGVAALASRDAHGSPQPPRVAIGFAGVLHDQRQLPAPLYLRASERVRLSPSGRELYATAEDGAALVLEAATGRELQRIPLRPLTGAAQGPLDAVRALATLPDRTVLVEAWRPFPQERRDMLGTYVPSGVDEPERGRNPGSAEPGPDLPRIWLRISPGAMQAGVPAAGAPALQVTRWWHAATARWLDSICLAPSQDLSHGLLLQIINIGAAGDGLPHLWLGALDRAGTRTERDLANPFPPTMRAPVATLLDASADAASALVLVRAHRNALVALPDDPQSRAQALALAANGQAQAASRDGEAGVLPLLEQMLVFMKYHRTGSFDGAHLILPFAQWQVWLAEPGSGLFIPVCPLFGEAGAPDAKDEMGMPGAPSAGHDGPHLAYSARAGLLALALASPPTDPASPGRAQARGLQLIFLPTRPAEPAQPRR